MLDDCWKRLRVWEMDHRYMEPRCNRSRFEHRWSDCYAKLLRLYHIYLCLCCDNNWIRLSLLFASWSHLYLLLQRSWRRWVMNDFWIKYVILIIHLSLFELWHIHEMFYLLEIVKHFWMRFPRVNNCYKRFVLRNSIFFK